MFDMNKLDPVALTDYVFTHCTVNDKGNIEKTEMKKVMKILFDKEESEITPA